MISKKQQLTTRLQFFLYILINILFEEYTCQELNEPQYKVLKINQNFEFTQKQTAITYKLNLHSNSMQNYKYFIIDTILVDQYGLNQKLVACLNFNYDILEDKTLKNQDQYKCDYKDNTPRIYQIQQNLIVINTSDPIFKANKEAYLTIIFYNDSTKSLNFKEQLPKKINYNIFTYYFNSRQCHGYCNGDHGVCDEKQGVCKCNKNYFDLDCSIETKQVQINNINEISNVVIYPLKTNYYKFNITQLIQLTNGRDISLNFQKLNGKAEIDIYFLFNKEELPQNDNNDFKLKMTSSEIKLSHLKLQCQKYSNSQNQNNYISNETLNNSTSQEQDNCFATIALQQQSLDTSILIFSFKIDQSVEKNNKNSNNNINNNNNSFDEQTPTKAQEQQSNTLPKEQKKKNIIIIAICCPLGLIIIGIVFLKWRKSKFQQQPNIISHSLPIQNQETIVVQVDNQINNIIKVEQKKKLLNSKRRILQEYLMPVIIHIPLPSFRQSIQNIEQIINQNYKTQDLQVKETDRKNQKPQDIYLSQEVESKQQNISKSRISESFKSKNDNQNLNCDLENQQNISLNQKNSQCCAICLGEFIHEDKVRKTICNHNFHIDCLNNWLNKMDNCPLCRQSFGIMDMIDYLTQQLRNKTTRKDQKIKINNERNKIKSLIEKENTEVASLSDEEFINLFSFFLPENQQKQSTDTLIQETEEGQNQYTQYIPKTPIRSLKLCSMSLEQSSNKLIQNINSNKNSNINNCDFGNLFENQSQQSPMIRYFSSKQNNLTENFQLSEQFDTNAESLSPTCLLNKLGSTQSDEIKQEENNRNRSEVCINYEKMVDPYKKTQSLKSIILDQENDIKPQINKQTQKNKHQNNNFLSHRQRHSFIIHEQLLQINQ